MAPRAPFTDNEKQVQPLPDPTHSGGLALGAPPEAPSESRAAQTIWDIFQSGRPLVYIRSAEEQRVARILQEVALRRFTPPVPVWTWSLTEGLPPQSTQPPTPAPTNPRAALDFIAAHPGPAIFHLKDFHEPLRDSAEVRRRLRDVYESCPRPAQVRRHHLPGPLHSRRSRA